MKKITILTITALSSVALVAAGCSSATNTVTTNANQSKTTANSANTNTANTATTSKKEEDAPASIKAALPNAQSFTVQHKDIPKDAIADIEKDAGGKVPDTDHHSYLAFSTTGGSRKQIGAGTIVKAGGKELVVVYDSKDGSPVIKEVRADGVSADFLKQFAGKGHDSDLLVGSDIKATGGVNEAQAKAFTEAIKIDVLTMQALYGAAHSH